MQLSLTLDIAIGLGLLSYTLYGMRAGFALSVSGLAGFVLGAVGAFFAIPLITSAITDPDWRVRTVLIAVFGLPVTGQLLGSSIGRTIQQRLKRSPLNIVNRLLGGAVNLIVAAIVLPMLAFGVGALGVPIVSSAIASSSVITAINGLTPDPLKALEAQIRALVTQDAVPRLLGALAPDATIAVPTASDGTAAQILAGKSVVKITGSAYQCGQNQSGSGFVIAANRVITNAHVVAGVDSPVVEVNGQAHSATVVHFDTQKDLAVLAVKGLGVAPISIGYTLAPGTKAVFDGFPLGGPYSTSQAAVQQVSTARIPDIYGGNDSPREIYYLSANVQEGNSGGPLIATNGQVVGVIFAKSPTSQNLGFALTMSELAPVAQGAAGYAAPVSSGHCTKG